MDKRKSILNIGVSLFFNVLTLFLAVITKGLLIRFCGNEVNGLHALYLSIIGFLSVSELGVGTAISFCMYRPIVEGDLDKVAGLYHLFRRLYAFIGWVILLSGMAMMPFLRYFAKDYIQIHVNLQLSFVLMLLSVVGTYWFGAKTALINAYKDNYITTAITSGGFVLQNLLQIFTLLTTGSFLKYLTCRIAATAFQWLLTNVVAEKKHSAILENPQTVDPQTKAELVKNIRAMFLHKLSALLVHTTDNILISTFIGVAVLGVYSNYIMVLNSMAGIIVLIFQSLTSVWGHLYVQKPKNVIQKYCEAFHLLNFGIGAVFYLGYYAVIDSLIAILFSPQLVLPRSITLVITFNGFLQFLRQNTLVFRDATGTFYNDRWKALAEGLANLVLSVLLVQKLGIVGVITATVFTNLLICHTAEPFFLYKHAFCASAKGYYWKNYSMILLFAAGLFVLQHTMQPFASQWTALFVNGCISVVISLILCAIAAAMHWMAFEQ